MFDGIQLYGMVSITTDVLSRLLLLEDNHTGKILVVRMEFGNHELNREKAQYSVTVRNLCRITNCISMHALCSLFS